MELPKKAFRSEAENTFAIRRPATLDFDCLFKAIKLVQYKTMTPYSASIAIQTTLRLGPWVFAAQFNKFLEIHRTIYYHFYVLFTGYAGSFWGGCSAKAPPFSNKKSLRTRGSIIPKIFLSCQRILKIFAPI